MDRFHESGSRHGGMESRSRRSSRPKSYVLSNSSSVSDDGDFKGSSVTSYGRKVNRDIVRCETPPPVFKRIVERAPTPEPEVIERVVVRPAPQTIVERVIERPETPPPRIIEREVAESPQPTIVRTRVIKVDSRGNCHYNRGYIRPSSGRVSRYDDYWSRSKCRSQSRYRSRPSSRYSRSISRSTSRHSYHPSVQLSRSQSFDVIRIPGNPVGPQHSGNPLGIQHSGNSVDPQHMYLNNQANEYPQYYTDKYHNSVMGNSYGPAQNVFPSNVHSMPYQQSPTAHHHIISPHQSSGFSQLHNSNHTPITYQLGGNPVNQHGQYQLGMSQQPNVIQLPSVNLTPAHMQFLGLPYPLY